ncbi:MAG: hypothetical protein ABF377_05845, partial [Akkermansiaceae bacterium]
LIEALFLTGVGSQDLYVSELLSHPADGGAEFFEIANRGSVRHLLSDLRITGGIQFEFSGASVTGLDPGERIVLVRDTTTFSLVYPTVGFGGDYDGGLGNGSDSFSLEELGGNVLWTLSYEDDAPWPSGTDGDGRSFVYVGGGASVPTSWRPSLEFGGNPGTSDRVAFVEGGSLAEYAVAGQEVELEGTMTIFEVELNGGADDAILTPEWSHDLSTWNENGFGLISQEVLGNGLVKQRWGIGVNPLEGKLFFRANLEER